MGQCTSETSERQRDTRNKGSAIRDPSKNPKESFERRNDDSKDVLPEQWSVIHTCQRCKELIGEDEEVVGPLRGPFFHIRCKELEKKSTQVRADSSAPELTAASEQPGKHKDGKDGEQIIVVSHKKSPMSASTEQNMLQEGGDPPPELSVAEISRKEVPAKSALDSLAKDPEKKAVPVREEEKKRELSIEDSKRKFTEEKAGTFNS